MDCDELISLVFGKPPLWDKNDKRHSNRFVVDKCWKEISEAMDYDENKLKKKWRYLRDQFSVEYGKHCASLSGDGQSNSYEPKWPYYKSLMFLKDIIKPRQSSKRHSSRTLVEQNHDFDDTQDNSDHDQDDSNPGHYIVINDSYDIEAKSVTDSPRDSSAVPSKKQSHSFNQNMIEIKRPKLDYYQKERSKNEDDDEHLLFFKSLLPHIRKIPQEKVLSFRNEIQRTVDIYAYQTQISTSFETEPILQTIYINNSHENTADVKNELRKSKIKVNIEQGKN